MDHYKPDPALLNLDYKALFSMADYLHRQSEIVLALARKKQAKEDEKLETERRIMCLQESYKTVMRMLRRGMSLSEAIEETAKIIQTPITTIEKRWEDFLADTNRTNSRQRHILIRDLSSIGITNVEIGRRLGMHPVTISRILSRAVSYTHLTLPTTSRV